MVQLVAAPGCVGMRWVVGSRRWLLIILAIFHQALSLASIKLCALWLALGQKTQRSSISLFTDMIMTS